MDQQNGDLNSQGLLQQTNPIADLYAQANIKQPWDDFQQFNVNPYNANGVQALPQDPNLSAQNLEAYAAGMNAYPINSEPLQQYNYDNTGVNDQLLQNNGKPIFSFDIAIQVFAFGKINECFL